MTPKILVVGSINMDLVTITKRTPIIGETIIGNNFKMIPGGKGANQAVAAARMGAEVAFIGCVGDDIYGDRLLQTLRNENINISGVAKANDLPTGIATIIVDEQGNNSIIVIAGANSNVLSGSLYSNMELIDWCDIIILQLEIPLETVMECIMEGKKRGKTIIFNPAPVQRLDESIYKYIDYLIVNEIEAKQISETDEENYSMLVEKLLKMGFKNVLMTVGENGVLFNEGSEIKHITAIKVNTIDTTAAGDSFVGTFATSIGNGSDKSTAVNDAVRAAAITVTRIGAQSSLPYKYEIWFLLQLAYIW